MISITRPDLYSTIRDMLGRPAPQSPPRPASTLCAVKGHVSLVGAGPGSADLITMRGLQKLQQADVVYYDRLADPALLHHVRRGAAKVFVGKAPGCHAVPQDKINQLIVRAALRGQQVVRLKCGDPGGIRARRGRGGGLRCGRRRVGYRARSNRSLCGSGFGAVFSDRTRPDRTADPCHGSSAP